MIWGTVKLRLGEFFKRKRHKGKEEYGEYDKISIIPNEIDTDYLQINSTDDGRLIARIGLNKVDGLLHVNFFARGIHLKDSLARSNLKFLCDKEEYIVYLERLSGMYTGFGIICIDKYKFTLHIYGEDIDLNEQVDLLEMIGSSTTVINSVEIEIKNADNVAVRFDEDYHMDRCESIAKKLNEQREV